MKRQINSIQEWIPIERILEDGIIKLKNNSYIKIIKVIPINFSLKSNLEKQSILNSYQIFLKTCNFNFQILIQTNKEDLSKHIYTIKKNIEKEKELLQTIGEAYIEYIENMNLQKTSSSKAFYIIIKNNSLNKELKENIEEIVVEELNENYFKIKECLSRCGNIVSQFNEKKEFISFLFSCFHSKNFDSNKRR